MSTVYLNGWSRIFHVDPDCPAARKTKYLQTTTGDGSNILNGKPCKQCTQKKDSK